MPTPAPPPSADEATEPRPDPRGDRYDRLLSLIDINTGRGLEIGPLNRPIAQKERADVDYVDVYDKATLTQVYESSPLIPPADIIEPDYTLISDGTSRTLPEAVAPGAPYDWIIASHVIEHVPDLVGWLEDIAGVMAADGKLALIVPDFRFTFDAARPLTTVGEILLAHQHRDTTPSVRAVYDHAKYVVHTVADKAWQGWRPTVSDRVHDLTFVRRQTAAALETDDYIDCHVWLFSPWTFIDQMRELVDLDLVPFVVERLIPTSQYEIEFFVALRRVDPALGRVERTALQFRALDEAERCLGDPPSLEPPPDPAQHWEIRGLSDRERAIIETKRNAMRVARGALRRGRRLLDRSS